MQIVVMRTMGFRQAAQLELAMGSIQLRGLAIVSTVMGLLTGAVSDNSDANRTKQYLDGFSFEEFTDGLSKTIMASEILTGTGDNSEQLYPRNAAQRVAASVPNNQRSFISASQLDTFGQALAASGTWNATGGSWWGWIGHGNSMINCAAPPNWEHPSGGAGSGA